MKKQKTVSSEYEATLKILEILNGKNFRECKTILEYVNTRIEGYSILRFTPPD